MALKTMGVVTSRHGVGMVVNEEVSLATALDTMGVSLLLRPRDETLRDLFACRRIIECETVRQAALHATPLEVAELSHLAVLMTSSTEAEEFIEADTEFHVAIARASHNRIWALLLQLIRALLRTEMLTVVHKEGRLEAASLDHLEIVRALAARDADGAEAGMERHLSIYRNLVIGIDGGEASNDGDTNLA